jgi:hypothetical protein
MDPPGAPGAEPVTCRVTEEAVGSADTEGTTAKARETAAVPVAVTRRALRTALDADEDKRMVELLLLPESR